MTVSILKLSVHMRNVPPGLGTRIQGEELHSLHCTKNGQKSKYLVSRFKISALSIFIIIQFLFALS